MLARGSFMSAYHEPSLRVPTFSLRHNKVLLLLAAGVIAFGAGLTAGGAFANERYQVRTSVGVSPDLMAPWVVQLQRAPAGAVQVQTRQRLLEQRTIILQQQRQKTPRNIAALLAQPGAKVKPRSAAQAEKMGRGVAEKWLPQVVDYQTNEKPGSIVIDTNERFLYLVMKDGKARRYGVGVGKPGFEWAGTHKVTRKTEWPTWTPPAEMKARVLKQEGRVLPASMKGGPENPLGARALYLGSTLYRIHGTNQPWTIGGAVSSGCIRMRNEDVIDLYERVKVGTKVMVI
jgi:lipoprotein-anchoring transpeptidase ErfK/SrfK